MKYASKDDLLDDIAKEHDTLCSLIESTPRELYAEPGVWGDDWTIHDLIAHLAEWHAMFLGWHRAGLRGETPEMPAPGYKWNETPRLNRQIQKRHASRPFAAVREEFDATYADIVDLLDGLSEASILEPGHFAWTGKNALVTYAGANTASHYRFANNAIKRWLRNRDDTV